MENVLSDLIKTLGSAGLLVVLSLIVIFVIAAVIAAIQGREVSLWPPKIGPAAPASGSAVGPSGDHLKVELEAAHLPVASQVAINPLATQQAAFDTEYHVSNAVEFYDQIAPTYDIRNSSDLLRTHQAVASRIKDARLGHAPFRVLDLGGGTGRQVATQFYDKSELYWTYVDFSQAMVDQFRDNVRGTPLGKNSRVFLEDINVVARAFDESEFDLVLMSLVLSSMPSTPDLRSIARVIKPGGLLVVADINPVYTATNPYYAVIKKDGGGKVALRTNPVNPFGLAEEAKAAGMNQIELTGIGTKDQSYSFIGVFQRF